MQDGVLDAADVLVDRQPVVHVVLSKALVVACAGSRSAGSTSRSTATGRACRSRGGRRRRTAGRSVRTKPSWAASGLPRSGWKSTSSGSTHRQVLLGHRHGAAGGAVDDRDRGAPVALAADEPVADAVGDRLAEAALRRARSDVVHGLAVAAGPSNGPELTITPARVRLGPVDSAAWRPTAEGRGACSAGTTTDDREAVRRANSKSRWSSPGTAMTAPVPYSIST